MIIYSKNSRINHIIMIQIDDKLISEDVIDNKFVCDLNACKGACCIEGDSGAPITQDEIKGVKENISVIKKYMRKKGIDAIEANDVFYLDEENEAVTTLVNGKECAFVYFDKNNIAKCSIEKAYKEKQIKINKPISCHLYPIRVKKLNEFTAINIDHWKICKPACSCGDKLNVKVYRFLKNAIIKNWGKEFFHQLEIVDSNLDR
tara:strand:- start:13376 stop:13987 length:612 start_codon:yes stop_codon:yes gene_type:complete